MNKIGMKITRLSEIIYEEICRRLHSVFIYKATLKYHGGSQSSNEDGY